MIKNFGWAYFKAKNREQDQEQNDNQDNKFGIFRKTKYFGGFGNQIQSEPKPDNDNDPDDNNNRYGIFFKHLDRSELNNSFSENYPLGGMIELYDIEREKEMCLNQNTCFTRADV